jgi:hypothetical protein
MVTSAAGVLGSATVDLLAADLLPMGSKNAEEGEVRLRSVSGALFSFCAVYSWPVRAPRIVAC